MARRRGYKKRPLQIDRMRRDGECPPARNSCGKLAYPTREAARHGIRRHSQGDQMRPYRCDGCGLWHAGHLPTAVKRGHLTADEYYGRAS